ncbi:hypothetical protein BC827DRAFT_749602 [Russula dissimulans]|nr:hypothetical protein BC827DRAFT_749602 [Russula dissimulans]
MFSLILPLAFHLGLVTVRAQTYTATYTPSDLPNQTEQGQAGTNQCSNTYNQTSQCQTAWVNSLNDFCIWAPPDPGPNSVIGETERIEVAWCTQGNHGTRLIPDGTITGAHFIQTPNWVQVTGVGDLTKINIPAGDEGGELDPHGADGNGNPIGGILFTTAFTGQPVQAHEWTNFVAADQFCIRVCLDSAQAPGLCNHIYDTEGCQWNMPGDYDPGFSTCLGDTGQPMGSDQNPVATSSCTTTSTISNTVGVTSTSSPTSQSTAPPATKTANAAAASKTSKSNAALALYLPSGGSLVSVFGVVLGAFML